MEFDASDGALEVLVRLRFKDERLLVSLGQIDVLEEEQKLRSAHKLVFGVSGRLGL